MSEFVLYLFVILLAFAGVAGVINRIPKTGRCPDASGKEIEAKIINRNPTAEKAVTMRLRDEDGKKYRVKLKASEAKLWIKGDSVKVLCSETSKNYRVLFHDYFKNNEERIREYAMEKLRKTVKPYLIAGHLVDYKRETPEAFQASGADSQTIFAFTTYMRMIDVYSVVAVILAAAFLYWYAVSKPGFSQLLLPLILVVLLFVVLNGAVNSCKRVIKSISK